MALRLLQFGNGKGGANHKRILKELGHEVKTYDIEDKYWEILNTHRDNFDGVIITTSSVNHWPIAKMCMDLDIPVFVEKPILLKKSQLEELKVLAPKKLIMAGHQLVFMPEVAKLKGVVGFMDSTRAGAIPRTEGSLFSLMVHDIAVAFYVTGADKFICTWAEGNRHEIKASLKGNNGTFVELYAISVSKVRLRHTTFVTSGNVIKMHPDNWGRVDILSLEMEFFCGCIEQKHPIEFNGADDAIKVMSTVFAIQDKLEKGKSHES